jgi:site-specific recombinase XerD
MRSQKSMTDNALVGKEKAAAVERVKAQARAIADAPDLAELPDEVLAKLAEAVAIDNWKALLKGEADRMRVDYESDRERWLGQASRTGSRHTRELYRRAIARLEAWCKTQGIEVLELTPATADRWIAHLKEQGRASATVRLDVAAASAFWTQMERWHGWLRNPFRGTRARPERQAKRKLEVPSEAEVAAMEAEADGWLRAAVVVMARAGLRVGALPSLQINGGQWAAMTQGKRRIGAMPHEARKAIERAGLPLRGPFSNRTAQTVKDTFRVLAKRLRVAGKLQAVYSAHDLRHAFAMRLYEQTRDIYRVRQALGHASVSVTEGYLRSLGLTS